MLYLIRNCEFKILHDLPYYPSNSNIIKLKLIYLKELVSTSQVMDLNAGNVRLSAFLNVNIHYERKHKMVFVHSHSRNTIL